MGKVIAWLIEHPKFIEGVKTIVYQVVIPLIAEKEAKKDDSI